MRRLKNRAKDPDDALELVIVRDMWLTGFDSPSMHTMYVDKPMRGAPLMQAIARVNRTFRDKPAGLVVDYLGIAEDLKSALADYTKRDQDNQGLGQDLREQAIPALVEEHEIVCSILDGYPWRQALARGGDQAYLRTVAGTADWLLGYHPGLPESACTKETPVPEVPIHGTRPPRHVAVRRVRARRGGAGDPRGCRLHRGGPRLDRQDREPTARAGIRRPNSTLRSNRSSPSTSRAPT